MTNKSNTPFYIGWQEKMDSGHKSFLKKMILPLFVILPVLIFALVIFAKPFNSFQFEFGTVKEFTGTYYSSPTPMLRVESADWPEGISRTSLLVGYGKFGAKSIMTKLAREHGELKGRKITLKGSLIYGDGKAVIELTEEDKSLVKIHKVEPVGKTPIKQLDKIKRSGEIIDPKCYFGVMKPGEGKIHKSCAIRCISGGIPPVLHAKNGQYYLLFGSQGQTINKSVLPFVAEEITLQGIPAKFLEWDVLYVDMESIVTK